MFGPKELMVVLIVLVIVLVLFGPKRIKSLGSELGNAIKGFRHAVKDKDAEAEAQAVASEGTEAAPAARATTAATTAEEGKQTQNV